MEAFFSCRFFVVRIFCANANVQHIVALFCFVLSLLWLKFLLCMLNDLSFFATNVVLSIIPLLKPSRSLLWISQSLSSLSRLSVLLFTLCPDFSGVWWVPNNCSWLREQIIHLYASRVNSCKCAFVSCFRCFDKILVLSFYSYFRCRSPWKDGSELSLRFSLQTH